MRHAPTETMQQPKDKFAETTSWADIAKELDSYAAQLDGAGGAASGETIEVKDLLRTLRERHGDIGGDLDSEEINIEGDDDILPY